MASPPVFPEPDARFGLRFGLRPPLGRSDEVHRWLRLHAMHAGSRHLGLKEKVVAELLQPVGYTLEELDKAIRDYGNFYNMYEKDGNVSFAVMPQEPPPRWREYGELRDDDYVPAAPPPDVAAVV
mmetsp:Transcript_32311/g.64448  ORF Transcript_32311/g.64448 Transcript_32311/m.64448 type:complete len:125 (-) Transcript_32311:281-655(-)|eukprot:CAMPEP_0174717254 /NCGR_PEP_ID=MMETSP1094-20130205/26333_1 /TAXON_ID=156173 /ORGANISM="Chrysochromulina brevifilum, Strain UTEX LB 985" /LENGTH=124 /DNA_ID=CAMNT_0015917167 /DNA_START=33 /DNA_END=407 /DNA_ORIENTATION=+